MSAKLFNVVCVLASAGLVAGHDQVYHVSAVIVDTPDNSSCPAHNELAAIRNNISSNILNILAGITAYIPACNGSGWRRVAYLNMTNRDQTCPTSWRLFERGSVRACGRQRNDGASCDSVQFSTGGHHYTQVCGRIIGYQYASPDGLFVPTTDINSVYVDGISVTHGSPRQHIWTLYAGVREFSDGCCTDESTAASFVGTNYFCDTGNPTNREWRNVWFPEHPLWDDTANCGSSDTCCAPQSGPWFHTEISPTADDIEIRICGEEQSSNENTPVELIEIYVK